MAKPTGAGTDAIARARAKDNDTNALEPEQVAFLEAYERMASVTAAAEIAGVMPRQHYRWLRASPAYADAFAGADVIAVQTLEQEAIRRARDGVLTPKGIAGQCIDVVEYSDQLLMFLLRGRRPEVYGDRFRAEVSGPGGAPIQHEIAVRLVDAVAPAIEAARVVDVEAEEGG